jgi:hypothetical protein
LVTTARESPDDSQIHDRLVKKNGGLQETAPRRLLYWFSTDQDASATHGTEVIMKPVALIPQSRAAILTLAEIKAASEAFDKGEVNAYDTLDAIVAAIEAYHAAEQRRRKAA